MNHYNPMDDLLLGDKVFRDVHDVLITLVPVVDGMVASNSLNKFYHSAKTARTEEAMYLNVFSPLLLEHQAK